MFKTPRPVAPDPDGTRNRDTGRRSPPVDAKHPTPVFLAALSALLAAAIFIGDLLVPLGVAGGVPYVAVILVGWWYPKRRYIFFLAAITSALTFAGYVWSPDGGIPWMVVSNRLLALFAIWVTAFLLIAAKTATAKMRESGARLAGAIESLQEGFILYDADDRMVMINDVYRGINFKAEEYLKRGMSFEDLIRANVESGRIVEAVGREEEFIRERLEQHRNPGPPILRQFNDGRWCVIKETRTPEGGTALTFSDVTDLKESERALSETEAIRKSEERLRMIFETSPIGVSIFVPKTNTRLYMNPAMVKLFGAETEEQLLEQNITETWANPSDLNRLREMDKNDFVEEIEAKRLRLDGTVWWCHLHRRRIEFEGQNAIMNWHYDISERKEAEQKIKRINEDLELRVEERTKELQKSEALFRAVVNHSPAKIHIKDTVGRYTLINKQASKLFGVTDEEGRGKTVYDLFEKDMADAFMAHDQAVISSGEAKEQEEEFTLEDGVHTYLTTKFPIFDQDGITGIGAIGTDITERKRAETKLRDSEERLRESQKMEAMGQLTGGIAHDFNNLLGIIIGHLELVQSIGIMDNDTREDIEEAQKAALRGASLTQQLLDFSRHKPRRSRSVNINPIIENMEEMLAKSLTSGIDIEFHLANGLWTTELDVSDLENAILNMSINAHDAMSKGDVLTIKTKNETLNRVDVASIPELSPGKYVVLSVSDTGTGMSRKMADQVFDPFFTTKEKGTGLGLSTVYGFVKRSGGNITVDSKLGRGTTFRIYLPKSSLKSEKLAPAKKSEAEMPSGMETILVVDDETKLLKSTTKILKSLGYTVYIAKDARQALKTLKNKENIDLLFSDVVMPGKMNGFELARNACEKNPDLKVLITSGFEQAAFKKAAYSGFSKNLLPKPYRMTELATRIRTTLDTGK